MNRDLELEMCLEIFWARQNKMSISQKQSSRNVPPPMDKDTFDMFVSI